MLLAEPPVHQHRSMAADKISAGVAVNLGLELEALNYHAGQHRPFVFERFMEKHLVSNGLVPRK